MIEKFDKQYAAGNESLLARLAELEAVEERRQSLEKTLHDSELRLQAILNYTVGFLAILSPDGIILDSNETPLRSVGYDRSQFVGMRFWETPYWIGRPELQSDIQADVMDAAQGQASRGEWKYYSADGSERFVDRSLTPIIDEHGDVTFIIAEGRDITDRIRAVETLRQSHDELEELVAESATELVHSEERFYSLVSTAPDLIFMMSADGTIKYINRSNQGFSTDDLVGSSGYEYLRPQDREEMKQLVQNVIRTGQFRSLEAMVDDEDGSDRWWNLRVGPFREYGIIVGVTCIATDITDRKRAEERLRSEEQLLRKLLDLQERERKLLAHDIHDGFVQDVIGAKMVLEGLSYRLKSLDEKCHTQIQKTCDLLAGAINEARRMISHLRPMSIEERGVIDAVNFLIADVEQKWPLTVDFEYEVQFDRLDPMLEGAMFRIIQEALNNVLRHSGAERAYVKMIQRNNNIQIEIRDEGVGFDEDQVPHDRFGLRGIRERARLFGGRAEISTTRGEGTTVSVELPLNV